MSLITNCMDGSNLLYNSYRDHEAYDPIQSWIDYVLRDVALYHHGVTFLLFRGIIIGTFEYPLTLLCLSLFWFIIKHGGKAHILDKMTKWFHWKYDLS
jgi:hypothetical protein